MPGRILFILRGNICGRPGNFAGILGIGGSGGLGGSGGIAIMMGIAGPGDRAGRDLPVRVEECPGELRGRGAACPEILRVMDYCRDRSGPVLFEGKFMLRDYRLPRDFSLLRHFLCCGANRILLHYLCCGISYAAGIIKCRGLKP